MEESMDGSTFDKWTRMFAQRRSRRTVIKGAAGVAAAVAVTRVAADEAWAAPERQACVNGQDCLFANDTCVSGFCICTPDCDALTCGDDGCGGTCGTCSGADTCYLGNCCTPTCISGKCGGDTCGGECLCANGETCDDGYCVPACSDLGEGCLSTDDCCGGLTCDGEGDGRVCVFEDLCLATGDECESNRQCCSYWCLSGVCACNIGGETCEADSECCSDVCVSGYCMDLEECPAHGDPCVNGECCPGDVCVNGMCEHAGCEHDADCGTSEFCCCDDGTCDADCCGTTTTVTTPPKTGAGAGAGVNLAGAAALAGAAVIAGAVVRTRQAESQD
jgi:hypothetical protein